MSWKQETFGSLLTESRIPCDNPNSENRIRVKLNMKGVEKRPDTNEKKGATKQYIRKAGQFIYGKQNFHKGAFGVIPPELDGFETSADIPSFDVREDCLPEWIYYFFKAGNRYLELTEIARGVGSQRIHPKQLQDLEIPLPPIDVQRKIISELELIEKDEISSELSHQLDLIKQLRQAFLREAMQGKLVQQDPNDEPASVLLEKIKAEKEQLIKEKKIKKQKPLPPISKDEIPFEIPDNWVWCRLGEVVEMSRGRFSIRPRNDPRYFNGDFPFLQIGSLDEIGSLIFEAPQTLNEAGLKASKMFPVNTIAIAIVGGTIGNLGVLGRAMCFTDSMVGFFPFEKMYNQMFLLNFLRFKQPEIKFASYQMAGQPNIKIPTLSELYFPLPPLSEQKRIVTKLDELMTYCDSLEASIKESQVQNELLLQQILREALEPKEVAE